MNGFQKQEKMGGKVCQFWGRYIQQYWDPIWRSTASLVNTRLKAWVSRTGTMRPYSKTAGNLNLIPLCIIIKSMIIKTCMDVQMYYSIDPTWLFKKAINESGICSLKDSPFKPCKVPTTTNIMRCLGQKFTQISIHLSLSFSIIIISYLVWTINYLFF